jgi:hypothetical protein
MPASRLLARIEQKKATVKGANLIEPHYHPHAHGHHRDLSHKFGVKQEYRASSIRDCGHPGALDDR